MTQISRMNFGATGRKWRRWLPRRCVGEQFRGELQESVCGFLARLKDRIPECLNQERHRRSGHLTRAWITDTAKAAQHANRPGSDLRVWIGKDCNENGDRDRCLLEKKQSIGGLFGYLGVVTVGAPNQHRHRIAGVPYQKRQLIYRQQRLEGARRK